MMNAPPPFSPTTYGNFQILPSPTALPAAAKRTPIFDEKDFSIYFYFIIYHFVVNRLGETVTENHPQRARLLLSSFFRRAIVSEPCIWVKPAESEM